MGKGGKRSGAGRPKKRTTVDLATVEAVKDIAQTLKEFMDTGLAVLGREAPELIRMEIDQAKQDPNVKLTKLDVKGKEIKVHIYDKDIARLAQNSRQFLLKALFDMNASATRTDRPPAEEALRELIAIQVNVGEVTIGETNVASESRVLVGQAGDAGQRTESGDGSGAAEVIEGTARDIP